MIYQWKLPLYKIDAQAAGEELERITQTHNSLTPDAVVDESRSEDAVLHNCFEWDDQNAAERYREVQAQELIRNIVTVTVNDEEITEPVRAFVSIQNDYKPVNVVVRTKEYSDEMYRKALRDLQAYKRKYAGLEQLAEVFKAIDSALGEAS